MPRIPTQDRVNIPNQPSMAGQMDPNMAGTGGRAMQGLGKALGTFVSNVEKIKDGWQRAEVSTNYTTAKNSRKQQINEIMNRAQNDPNTGNRQVYLDEIEQVRGSMPQVGDERVQRVQDSETDLSLSIAGMQVTSFFKSKMVDFQRGQIVENTANTENDYNNTSSLQSEKARSLAHTIKDDGETYVESEILKYGTQIRQAIKDKNKEELKSYLDQGFITNAEYDGSIKDMDEWEYKRANIDLQEDPESVVRNLKTYDLTPKQKREVLKSAQVGVMRIHDNILFTKQAGRIMRYKSLWSAIDNGQVTPTMISTIEDKEIRAMAQEYHNKTYPAAAAEREDKIKRASKPTEADKIAKRKKRQDTHLDLEAQYDDMIDDDGDVFNEQNNMDSLLKFQKSVLDAEINGYITPAKRKSFLNPITPALDEIIKTVKTESNISSGYISAAYAIITGNGDDFFNGGSPKSIADKKINKSIYDLSTRLEPDSTYLMNKKRIELHGQVFAATEKTKEKLGRELTISEKAEVSDHVINQYKKNSNNLAKNMNIGDIVTIENTSYRMIGRNDKGQAEMQLLTSGSPVKADEDE